MINSSLFDVEYCITFLNTFQNQFSKLNHKYLVKEYEEKSSYNEDTYLIESLAR